MKKKKQREIINHKFYRIITDDIKKIKIEFKTETLAKANYKELAKEIDYLSNLSMNIFENKTDDNFYLSFKESVYLNLYIKLMEELNYFIERCLDGLYLIYSPKMDLLKIGITKNIDERIKNISRDVNDDVQLLSLHYEKSSLENFLHNKFKDDNVRFIGTTGTEHREWFKNKNYIKEYFKTI